MIDLFTTDWSEGAVKKGAQVLRFHIFTTMPGIIDNSVSLANLDYEQIKAVVYDLRKEAEWGKFMITSSGDGTVDPTKGEECDPKAIPPVTVGYDLNVAGTISQQKYPDATCTSTCASIPNGKVSWVAANTVLD